MSTGRLPDDSLLRLYLLGKRMEEVEQDRIERSYFESDECFDRLLEIEDDLIDTYIRGGLSPEERVQFERHFLAAGRHRERYEAMRAIAANFFRDGPRPRHSRLSGIRAFLVMQSSAARAAMAVLGIGAIVALGLLGARYARLSTEKANASALAASSRLAPARGELAFALAPGLLRSNSRRAGPRVACAAPEDDGVTTVSAVRGRPEHRAWRRGASPGRFGAGRRCGGSSNLSQSSDGGTRLRRLIGWDGD
jgi:anti-sigma factor RsiW